MRKLIVLTWLLGMIIPTMGWAQAPKHEFRGVWVQTVYQMQYQQMDKARMQEYFTTMLDKMKQLGINAFIFQVRPEADAFYKSNLEPWSRFLTGTQGVAPTETWDPMKFLIDECHQRGMEFHAWLNPYRVTASANQQLASNHVYHQHPEWFVTYGGKIYFDPGLPQSRKHFCSVIKDIVSRYDVDAIHMDDYFYPYPVNGEEFPDQASFATYGPRQGFTASQKDDWRRHNTDLLVKQIDATIRAKKPWVRFGISPFGIYRNQRNTPDGSGSLTNGLQNYDDLYADILKWDREGWIDYVLPQLYWEIGHKAADYETLIYWWNKNIKNAQLYVGQDINRSVKAPDLENPDKNQLDQKIDLTRKLSRVKGSCYWYGTDIMANNGGVQAQLRRLQKTKSLVPPYVNIYGNRPKEVKGLKAARINDLYMLMWKERTEKEPLDQPVKYGVYRFPKGTKVNLSQAEALVCTTSDPFYVLPSKNGTEKYTYVVTSINRTNVESPKGKKKTVKL